jgi:TIR domain
MSKNDHQSVQKLVAVLDQQRETLRRLHDEYYSAYDAAFDEYGAGASIRQWIDRTIKLIQENVSQAEATKFQRALSSAPRGRGSGNWEELCRYLHTYLVRLIEDIEEYPDDPGFAKASPIPVPLPAAAPRHDIFLSYSTVDKDEARRIQDALTNVGKTCFMSEKSLKPGDNFQDEIRSALEASNEIWILVSPNSIKSAWVHREIAAAWALRKRIVPILLRCAPGDLPEILADKHAIDFHKMTDHISDLR